jgi:sialidase-1
MFSQTVYRVNPESTEPEDGLTWNSGYKTIGAALVAAGDFSPTIIEIWVKSGTYKEAAFWLRNNVEIYGGFLGIESSRDLRDWKKNTTMLVPESAAKRIITRHSATSVKNGVLDGFTLTGVNGTQAAYLNSGNKLKNCIIRNNSNTGFGGGVYMGNGSTIENCLVKDNISEQSGGGIAAGHDNEMGYIKIINCEIVNNASNIDGGGVNVGSYNLEMYNTLIANNTCGGRGGGFRFATPSKASNIINCTIVNNLSGEGNEGGVYLSTISNNVVFVINSIIYGNKAGNQKSNINLNPRVLTSYSGIEDLPTELDKNGNINLMDNQFVNPTPTAGRYVAQDISESISVFENNTGGYACYRIPAITKAPNGDILAFVEARKNSCADFGDLDIVMKRSTDGGVTWSNLQLLVDRGENRAGNIAAVVDYFDSKFPQGRIFLIYHTLTPYINNAGQSRNVHEIWYKTSVDNGHTWENSINITTSVHRPYAPEYNPQYNFTAPWPSMVIGPSSGLQIRNGTKKGRIFVSSYHTVGNTTIPYSNSFVNGFFSDDNGKTWQNSPSINMPYGNESTVAQLADGSILQNFRYQTTSDFFNQPIDSKYRVLSLSTDGGNSWGEAKFHYDLPTPVCHGSMLDVSYNGTHYLFFSHPDSQTIRTKMTIFGSSNNGKTWDKRLLIDSGRSAYSALMWLDDETVGLIYELGDNGGVVFKQVKIGSIIK